MEEAPTITIFETAPTQRAPQRAVNKNYRQELPSFIFVSLQKYQLKMILTTIVMIYK